MAITDFCLNTGPHALSILPLLYIIFDPSENNYNTELASNGWLAINAENPV